MSQTFVFSAPADQTITGTARAQGSYSGGTAADTITWKTGTTMYEAVFNTNLSAGNYRLDLAIGGVQIGNFNFDNVSGSGTFYPREMLLDVLKIPRAAAALVPGAATTKTNTSESPAEVITEVLS